MFEKLKKRIQRAHYRRHRRRLQKMRHIHDHIHGVHHHFRHIHDIDTKNLSSLSIVPVGEYTFITTLCSPEMEHRLLEMGFVPQTVVKVIAKTGGQENGSVLIEIKGSKLALNFKTANEILVKEKSQKGDIEDEQENNCSSMRKSQLR